MGVGISLGRLAGSVAKEGAVGIISAAQIGYQEPDLTQMQEKQIACNWKRDGESKGNLAGWDYWI